MCSLVPQTVRLLLRPVSCYTYDIDGPAFAEHVRLQMQAQLEKTPGASALGLSAGASPVLQRLSGTGKVWLDANGLPLRQKIDMVMPEIDTYYDADIIMVIDYQFDPEVVAATSFATSILPTPEVILEAAKTTLPNVALFFSFVAVVVMLFLLYRRRWMYSFVAISIVTIMLLTPILQIINTSLYFAHEAHAAESVKPLVNTLAAETSAETATPALNRCGGQKRTHLCGGDTSPTPTAARAATATATVMVWPTTPNIAWAPTPTKPTPILTALTTARKLPVLRLMKRPGTVTH